MTASLSGPDCPAMTYCLGILANDGLLFAADSRTNAGIDYISAYQKLFDFSVPGERVIVLKDFLKWNEMKQDYKSYNIIFDTGPQPFQVDGCIDH